MVWGNLRGQPLAQRVLANQIKTGRTGHAYLFVGTPGTSMDDAALLFAQALNCTSDKQPCGRCTSCRAIEKGVHPDVRVVRPDGATIKLGQVKSITSEAVITPNQGRYRIYIIENAHTFTREAANALLLTLEEPPSFVVFILTATAAVPATIESRCQVIKFRRSLDPEMLVQTQAAVNLALNVMIKVLQATQSERVKYAEQLDKEGVDLPALLDGLLRLYRDLWIQQITAQDSLVAFPTVAEQVIATAGGNVMQLSGIIGKLLEAQRMLVHNVNRRLLLETILLAL